MDMNIALSPLIILLLAFPGILFRYYYRKGIEASPVTLRNVPEEIAWGSLFAGVMHAFGLMFLWSRNVMPGAGEIIVRLILGNYGEDAAKTAAFITQVTGYIPGMIFYITVVSAFGAILGLALHNAVDHWFLDIRIPQIFQFPNPWRYLFKGRAYLMDYVKAELGSERPTLKQLQNASARVSFTIVYAVIEQEQTPFVYGGVFDDFELASDGELDRIILTGAFRFPLPREKFPSLKQMPGYFDINAEKFVIQYSDVKTLALGYIFVEVDAEDAPVSDSTP